MAWYRCSPGSDLTAYHSNDATEQTLADDDYFPFYDTSASATRKMLWSRIKSYLSSLFASTSALTAMRQTIQTYKMTISSVSSLPVSRTYNNTNYELEVIRSVLSNPSAQTGDWTVTTSVSGNELTVTISGTISGTTDITLYLAYPEELTYLN